LQKFDGAMAAWLAELGYTPACSITISRDESVRSAGDGERFLKCCGE
jgi:hypothetical protein